MSRRSTTTGGLVIVNDQRRPTFQGSPFTCPHCGVLATQSWTRLSAGNQQDSNLFRSTCRNCKNPAYWAWEQLVAPAVPLGPPPNEDLSGDLLEVYMEAREIAGRSPRAAAALLRLLVEKLIHSLDSDGHEGERLDIRVTRLRETSRIDVGTYEALEAVKVAGDNAVHAGQIDPTAEDQAEVVVALFGIVNHIVTSTRSLHREVEEIRKAQAKARSEKGRRIAEQRRDAAQS